MMDLPDVRVKNLTIYGKLSFDDSWTLNNILVWGTLEIGRLAAEFGASTKDKPFGAETGKTTTIVLRGYVLNTEVIAVPGTAGSPVYRTLRLAMTIGENDESACVWNTTGPLEWPAGALVGFSPTEFDEPWDRTVSRTLTEAPEYDEENGCYRLRFSGSLGERRFADDIDVGGGKKVSLRGIVTRLDRTVPCLRRGEFNTGSLISVSW
ncbi:unnamed protein product [Symbiodinium sp. KB8]|nr:unnamed protein product [Symbiodinium sp. KB8]